MDHVIISGIGRRSTNQDQWMPKHNQPQSSIYLVCDGVGGGKHGDIASKITSDSITNHLALSSDYSQENILEAIIVAENALDLFKLKNDSAKHMSTTLSLLAFYSPYHAIASWVGDSRIYQIRNGEILYKSTDHSLGHFFLQMGIITENQLENFPQKNIITKVITGCDSSATPDFHSFNNIQKDDYFLISSDGFHEVISKEHIKLFTPSNTPKMIKIVLEGHCLKNSKDNYTCHIVKI
tara:strand:- start:34 stop:747 length:714 start_codon:yes stop_codon:yes gene_type:complete